MPAWLATEPGVLRWGLWLLATWLATGWLHARWPRWRVAGAIAVLGGALGWVLWATLRAPISAEHLSWIRFTVALAALGAVARRSFRPKTAPPHPLFELAVLSATAALGLLCFLNCARPQFQDAGRGAPTFLHHYDMRVYFPIARFFPELRFDGVYAASAAAMEDDLGPSEAFAAQRYRDLKTNQMVTVGQSRDFLREVRERFTPDRWALFTTDMRYFRRAMGDAGYLSSMNDHGGNATPVWFLGARLLFRDAPASDFTLWVGVLVDAALLLLCFGAIAWAFGVRAALVAMTAFGAMDFYLFGSNWFGAPLRHDWMALWGIGLALLKKEKLFLAGGVLAWATLIRVFPLMSLMTLAAPFLWAFATQRFTQRGQFSTARFLAEHRAWLRLALGAATFGSILFGLSVLNFGWASWPDWLRKASMISGPGLNTIALSSLIPTPWLLVPTGLGVTFVALYALRHAAPHEAAGFGPALVGICFSPSNYYLQSLMLLAVLGGDRRGGAWWILLAMCAGCFFTTFPPSFEGHFRAEAVVMLLAVAALIGWRFVVRRPACGSELQTQK